MISIHAPRAGGDSKPAQKQACAIYKTTNDLELRTRISLFHPYKRPKNRTRHYNPGANRSGKHCPLLLRTHKIRGSSGK